MTDTAVRAEIEARMGAVDVFVRLAEGSAAQAFGFRRNGEAYVVRIGRSLAAFAKDAFVQCRFGRPALAIPEVLEVGRFDDEHAFCLSRRAPGERLHDLGSMGTARLVEPVARVLEAVASSDLQGTRGYGPFDAAGVAPHASWRAFITSLEDTEQFEWQAVRRAVDGNLLERSWRVLDDLARRLPEERCLVHGDFGAFNVLADDSSITAVIDWDMALFGDPLYDGANLLFWGEEAMAPVLQHLTGRLGRQGGPAWRERLLGYALHSGLREIHLSVVGSGAVDVAWLVQRCTSLLHDLEVPRPQVW